jgi:hypothetical protein
MQLNVRSSVTTLDTGTRGGRGSALAILIVLLGFREPQICLPEGGSLHRYLSRDIPFSSSATTFWCRSLGTRVLACSSYEAFELPVTRAPHADALKPVVLPPPKKKGEEIYDYCLITTGYE